MMPIVSPATGKPPLMEGSDDDWIERLTSWSRYYGPRVHLKTPRGRPSTPDGEINARTYRESDRRHEQISK